jgi:hypothetical protein
LPYSQEKGVIYGLNNPKHGDISGKPEIQQAYEMGKRV